MKCIICKQADVRPGTTTVTLERDEVTLVVKSVPARVCPNCSEVYVDADVTKRLLRDAEDMVRAGTQMDIRQFLGA